MTMREVKLYGHLGKKFGKVFKLDVNSPAEAVAALRSNLEGFDKYMAETSAPGYHVLVDKTSIGEKALGLPCGRGTIKIIPAVAGAKANGVFGVVLGIVLVVAGVIFQNPMLIQAGISMIIGGVVAYLTRPPSRQNSEKPDNQPSYTFNGPVNTTTQGNPVPVCYGEMIVGSQVASFGLMVEDMSTPYHRAGGGSGGGGSGIGDGGGIGTVVNQIQSRTTSNMPPGTNLTSQNSFYSGVGQGMFQVYPGSGIDGLGHDYRYDLSLSQNGNTLNMSNVAYDKYTQSFMIDMAQHSSLSSFSAGASLSISGGNDPLWSTGSFDVT